MPKDTLIIMTGGTIDAEAYLDPANPPENATMLEHSLIPLTVAGMGHGARCDFLPWVAKDSKAFSTEEMRGLAKIIRTSSARNIIITHGTDAMPAHSRQIEKMLKAKDVHLLGNAFGKGFSAAEKVRDKVVVFTGAMMPLANGPESDAYKNLEYIFSHINQWKTGVRAVMHEKSFEPEGLKKNFKTYEFKGTEIPDHAASRGRI